jgi:DNA primase large subunit
MKKMERISMEDSIKLINSYIEDGKIDKECNEIENSGLSEEEREKISLAKEEIEKHLDALDKVASAIFVVKG